MPRYFTLLEKCTSPKNNLQACVYAYLKEKSNIIINDDAELLFFEQKFKKYIEDLNQLNPNCTAIKTDTLTEESGLIIYSLNFFQFNIHKSKE
jgi:hypothetical protein